MRKLVAPDWNAFDDYSEIAARSVVPNECRSTLRPKVERQHREYVNQRPHLESLTPLELAPREKESLETCYQHRIINKVKARIIGLQSGKDPLLATHCQLCSSMTLISNNWDHYIPKSLFPEFSACAYNLVPSCKICNEPRNNAWLSDEGHRRLLHLYYDEIHDAPYLRVKFDTTGDAAQMTFDLHMPEGGCPEFHERYRRHFDALDLAARYRTYYSIELNRIIDRIRRYTSLGLTDEVIQDGFARSAATEPAGSNSPLAALYRAAAASGELLAHARGEARS